MRHAPARIRIDAKVRDLVEVKESAVSGRGVFSKAPIQKGTFLGEYEGELLTEVDWKHREEFNDAHDVQVYTFQVTDGVFRDGTWVQDLR